MKVDYIVKERGFPLLLTQIKVKILKLVTNCTYTEGLKSLIASCHRK